MSFFLRMTIACSLCAFCGFGLVACDSTPCEDFCQQAADCGVEEPSQESCVTGCEEEQGDPVWACLVETCTETEDCTEMTGCIVGCAW